MKQQHIFKMILVRGITLFSTGITSQILCFINDLLLYVACLFSCFGNSKMVTECQPKPIPMDFGSPKEGEGGGGVMCGGCGAGLYWPQEKVHFRSNIQLIFPAIEGTMLPIYYRTSSSTFCQISGLEESFEKCNKYQNRPKSWVLGACI